MRRKKRTRKRKKIGKDEENTKTCEGKNKQREDEKDDYREQKMKARTEDET